MKHQGTWRTIGLVAAGAVALSMLPASAAEAQPQGTAPVPAPSRGLHSTDEPTLGQIAAAEASINAALRTGTPLVRHSLDRSASGPALAGLVRSSNLRDKAAASLKDCSGRYDGPFMCGSINVPTSASNPSLGQRRIDFVYRPADEQPATGVSLYSDGPTQSSFSKSSPWKPGFYSWVATAQGALFATQDVILVNTRGTGRDAVDCPMLQSDGNTFADAVAECTQILGSSIDYLTTGDSANDLDAVRAYLLGRKAKIDLVTMGHSTALGQAYLARYPQRVRTAVLDEAVNINAWADVEINDSTAIVGRACRRSARCSAQIHDAVGQVAWLAARVRNSPIVGMSTLSDGTPQRIVLGEVELALGLVAAEPGSYAYGAGLAAAIKAYRAGDAKPLLRIAANAGIGEGFSGPYLTQQAWDATEDWSASSFAASNCNEWPTAWDLSANETLRRTQAVNRLAAQPADLYGIFSHAVFDLTTWQECWAWPGPQRVNKIQPPGVPYATVPVLVMAGDLNTDHPATAARTVAKRYPNSTFVRIPRAGQPALYWSPCAGRVMEHFLAKKSAGNTHCSAKEGKAVLGIGSFPRYVSGEQPGRSASRADHSTRHDRRVVAAAVHTGLDAVIQALDVGGESGPGLRGGAWSVMFGDEGATFTLDGARFVRNVRVSGTVDYSWEGANGPAKLKVRGPGTDRGSLTVHWPSLFSLDNSKAHVTGHLGGRAIDVKVDIH